jgi:ankyrin repeat protein
MSLLADQYKHCAWAQATLALHSTPIDWLSYCTLLRTSPGEVLPCTGDLALRTAIQLCKLDYIRLLLAAGVDPNARCPVDDRAPLQLVAAAAAASVRGDPDHTTEWLRAADLLLAYGADVDVRDATHMCTPLMQALQLGANTAVAMAFVDAHGADVNAKDRYGLTALHYLAKARHADRDLVAFLLDRGADKMAVSRRGITPIDLARIRLAPAWMVRMLE